MSGRIWSDDIVPFAMKPIRLKMDALHFFLGDLAAGWIFAAVQSACHFRSFRSGRLGNEIDDGFLIAQRSPHQFDERKEKGGARSCSTRSFQVGNDRPRWAGCFIREGLQLPFPQAQPPAIPPPSAVIRILVDAGGSRLPSWRHHPRMDATADAPVSWSVPTVTNPVLARRRRCHRDSHAAHRA
jgi:hypothetical protein